MKYFLLPLFSILAVVTAAYGTGWQPFQVGISDQKIWNMENQDNDRFPQLPNYWEQKRKAD